MWAGLQSCDVLSGARRSTDDSHTWLLGGDPSPSPQGLSAGCFSVFVMCQLASPKEQSEQALCRVFMVWCHLCVRTLGLPEQSTTNWWLPTAEMCFLKLPEAKSSNLRCQQGCVLHENSRGGILPCLFLARLPMAASYPWHPWLVETFQPRSPSSHGCLP